jgi:hypothetical protein
VLVEGQAAQDDGVDHGEDRRAGADAERENRQRDAGEGWRRAQRAQGRAKVVEHVALDGGECQRVGRLSVVGAARRTDSDPNREPIGYGRVPAESTERRQFEGQYLVGSGHRPHDSPDTFRLLDAVARLCGRRRIRQTPTGLEDETIA